MEVTKRDGLRVDIDLSHLRSTIENAFRDAGIMYSTYTIDSLLSRLSLTDGITSAEIQSRVVTLLRDAGYGTVADLYLMYGDVTEYKGLIHSKLDYMNFYLSADANANDLSNTDANANTSLKNVVTMEGEVYKDINRRIRRADEVSLIIKYASSFGYDARLAKSFKRDLRGHIIYCHDEASSPARKPYCAAYSLYPLLLYGTSCIDGTGNHAPRHLSSFCGQFINLVFTLSAEKKGAGAYAEFFNYFWYFCVKKWGKDFYRRIDERYTDCFENETIGYTIDQHFQYVTHYINQPAGNRGRQSPFTNFNIFDSYYWHHMFNDFVFPDGTKIDWDGVDFLQRRYMCWLNHERLSCLLTFPVITVCLLTDGIKCLDSSYERFVCEQWAAGDSFFVYQSNNADSIASCCRLRNELDGNTFSSTIGLTGVQTGSCNVITLNIARIIQNFCIHTYGISRGEYFGKDIDWVKFDKYLRRILDRVYVYQRAYKSGLYELVDHNMLPAVTAGFIDLDKLYCTIGVNGLNEAGMYLGCDVSYNDRYMDAMSRILSIINEYNISSSSSRFKFNLELVPAETLGISNYNWDKADGYWVPDDRELYNSYIYDAHDATSVLDKIRMQGSRISDNCSGGQAAHINLEENLSFDQYLKLLRFAIHVGNKYITFNVPQTCCDHCGFIAKHPFSVCPRCGSTDVTYWTRIIGYLRPVKAWAKERRYEFSERVFMDHTGNGKRHIC